MSAEIDPRDLLADDTLRQYALPLVGKIRDEAPEDWGPWLESIPVERLRLLAIVLAALVPVDESVSDLLAWMQDRGRRIRDTATRTPGGELIDLVAVQQRLDGRKVPLTPAEQRVAIRLGTERGLSAAELGELLGITQRTVVRARSAVAA